MQKVMHFLLLICLFLNPVDAAKSLVAVANLEFHGHSSIHDFDGHVKTEPFKLVFQQTKEGKTVVDADIEVKVRGMDTRNGKRDNNMYDMFHANNNPLLQGSIRGLSPSQLHPSTPGSLILSGVVPMDLTILGKTKTVSVNVTDYLQQRAGGLKFKIAFPVSLRDFGLRPKRALFGMIRVYDNVEVEGSVFGRLEGPTRIELLKQKLQKQIK